MRQVAGTLRLDLAQYRELQAFAQFGSDLDKATQRQLNRGARLVEVLKQSQYAPLPVERQVMIIFAGTKGFLDEVAESDVAMYETELDRLMETRHPELVSRLAEEEKLSDELAAALDEVVREFSHQFVAARKGAAA